MDLGIAGRVALVMGASQGLGLAVAKALAAEGATVAMASRKQNSIELAASEVGGTPYVADTDEPHTMVELVDHVDARHGPVEILVTNSGGPQPGDPLSFGSDDWEAAYRNLVLSPLALIEAVAPAMRERGWGRIVNVGSSSTKEPIPGLVLSSANRLATIGLFKTLSRELARDGVLVNTVSPGRVLTKRLAELYGRPMEELEHEPAPDIPVGRLGRPEEYAAAVTFFCSEQASFITGVNLLVDGGLTAGL